MKSLMKNFYSKIKERIVKMKKEQRLKFSNLKRLTELINKHTENHPHFSLVHFAVTH